MKSQDGVSFDIIGEIDGAGNSLDEIRYTYLDETDLVNTAYYKLKQTDFDGQFSFSETIVLKRNLIVDNIKIFPNPISNG